MAICSISVVPVGTGSTSVSAYVADCQKILAEMEGVKYQLTPMATILEGELPVLLDAVRRLHRVPFERGAKRVLTTVALDERIDADVTMAGKLASVRKRIEKESG